VRRDPPSVLGAVSSLELGWCDEVMLLVHGGHLRYGVRLHHDSRPKIEPLDAEKLKLATQLSPNPEHRTLSKFQLPERPMTWLNKGLKIVGVIHQREIEINLINIQHPP
jgi:hypothetical protein